MAPEPISSADTARLEFLAMQLTYSKVNAPTWLASQGGVTVERGCDYRRGVILAITDNMAITAADP